MTPLVMIDLIIMAIVIIVYTVWYRNKQKKPSTKVDRTPSKTQTDYMPEDPKNYTFDLDGTRLIRYTGNSDTLCVPIGTRIIGNGESEIKANEKWHAVFIPKSVYRISDIALYYVDIVYYEGNEEEFRRIICDFDWNFKTGFIPNWAKNLPNPGNCKVNQVSFHYNVNIPEIYKAAAERRKNQKAD